MGRINHTLILFVICLLFPTLHLNGQNEFAGVVKFDKTTHDFGDLLIDEGNKRCTFTLTNISKKPIVIHRVITSCGCTDPTWTKKPIMPGEKGEINIVFKNDIGPYPFDKSITTYISDINKPIILRIKGIVHDKAKSLKDLYSYNIGGFGMREESLDMGQIEQGLSKNEEVEIANISSKSINVAFNNLTPGLSLSLKPNPIPPNSKGRLVCLIDTKCTASCLWGKNIFTANLTINGTQYKKKIAIKALIKENFSTLSETDRRKGSLPQFTSSSESFGKLKMGEKGKVTFEYKNLGKEELIFYKIDSSEEGADIDFTKNVTSGKSGKIEITIDSEKNGNKGEILYILTIITNSPSRPLVSIFITGEIE